MSSQTSSAAPIGVGFMGPSASGGWAAQAHLPALRAVRGYEVRALSASSAASAKAAGEKYGIPLALGSAEELVRGEEADLVVVAVTVPHHRELILPALDAGKMVLREWWATASPRPRNWPPWRRRGGPHLRGTAGPLSSAGSVRAGHDRR